MNEDFTEMTLEELIASQMRDDVPFARSEGNTLLLGGISNPEWIDGLLDHDTDTPVPVAHLPVEARPRTNGVPGSEASGSTWFSKMRTGEFGPKKGCKTHGMEFWSEPKSQPYCKKCRAERFYAKQQERGARARGGRKYA